ncbi:MAG: DUF502 domain-containing protein [Planctomycetaceae bacterium]
MANDPDHTGDLPTGDVPTGSAPDSVRPAPRNRRSRATQFFLRGLAITLPPILTLVILIWFGQILYTYVVYPISQGVRYTIAQFVDDSRPTAGLVRPAETFPQLEHADRRYRVTPEFHSALASAAPDAREAMLLQPGADVYYPFQEAAVPYGDYRRVADHLQPHQMPNTAIGVYMELVTLRYFGNLFFLSTVAVSLAVVGLYFLGGLMTARMGLWAVHKVESVFVQRVPVVSNVYSSVKQVTDFFFTERTVSYNRVVAIEYPRRGIWTIAFVTSDSLLEITAAANEPLVTVLVPTSPMPMTGFTVSVPRSEVIDLDFTIDQAFQFCLSCGVLVPPHQRVTHETLQRALAKRFAKVPLPIGAGASAVVDSPTSGNGPPGGGSSQGSPAVGPHANGPDADRRGAS